MPPHQFDDSVFLIVDFGIVGWQGDQKDETHFQIAVSCISQSLKTQIINRSYDEVAICFFNTVRLNGSVQLKTYARFFFFFFRI